MTTTRILKGSSGNVVPFDQAYWSLHCTDSIDDEANYLTATLAPGDMAFITYDFSSTLYAKSAFIQFMNKDLQQDDDYLRME